MLHPFQSCCRWSRGDFIIIDAGAEESRGGETPGLEHSFSVGGKSDGLKLGVLLLWRNTVPCGFNWSRKPGLVDWGPIEDCQRRVRKTERGQDELVLPSGQAGSRMSDELKLFRIQLRSGSRSEEEL